MKYDIVSLITSILDSAGLSTMLDTPLRHHSTISLTMKADIPAIHLTQENDGVWIWATVMESLPHSLHYCSADLLPLMMTYEEEYFIAGQPCLYSVHNRLELRAQVKEQYLHSPDTFLSLLDKYLIVLQDYRAVLI
ncbi:hypothetical protein [Tatumella ptyseos]|uniref:InvB/SpaK family type III secretion system chaperone n=1 Tax=Tatumella ptyseos TaxID=82987 RepID=UPI0026EBA6DA|nr:hypothetical protein [Tatumella ptyseos]WKX25759.1 hypothetical protein QJR74_10595 [Tatumella ptyseos]